MAGLLFLAGCPFTPRDAPKECDPNDPDCVLPAPFREPETPEIVRDNIKAAIERPTVEPNYRDSLTDLSPDNGGVDFVYVPDARAAAEATPGFFDGWDDDREVQFMLNLLEAGSARPRDVSFDFTQYTNTGELTDPNEARYLVQYELKLVFFVEADSTERLECYTARALWDLSGGNRNFWRLQRWEDLEPLDPDGPCNNTMGLLRALRGQEG